MALHVVIGYADQSRTAAPRVIYAGESASDARAAMAEDTTCARFEVLQNARGHRKNNPRFAAAAPAPAPSPPPDSPAPAPGPVSDPVEAPAAPSAPSPPPVSRGRK